MKVTTRPAATRKYLQNMVLDTHLASLSSLQYGFESRWDASASIAPSL